MIRGGLGALLEFLHRFAQPTGARGSVLLMTGGLIVLGFLFLTFLFRSTIVGDLAPVANARAPVPRADLPPSQPTEPRRIAEVRGVLAERLESDLRSFDESRAGSTAWGAGPLDEAIARMKDEGLDARIMRSTADGKLVRAYGCLSCERDEAVRGCEHERGLLAGAFESLTGELAKVEEIACRAAGAPHCEFDVRHARLPEALP